MQIFCKNANGRLAKPIAPDEIRFRGCRLLGPRDQYRAGCRNSLATLIQFRHRAIAPAAENSRLLCSLIWSHRAESLGLRGVVPHPQGRARAAAKRHAFRSSRRQLQLLQVTPAAEAHVLLEHTAGQGPPSAIASNISRRSRLRRRVAAGRRLPRHLSPARLRIRYLFGPGVYAGTFESFDRLVGIDRLKVFHLNDSKKPCGSRVDRHEHIGKGCLGLEPPFFRRLLTPSRFARKAILIERPKRPGLGARRKARGRFL